MSFRSRWEIRVKRVKFVRSSRSQFDCEIFEGLIYILKLFIIEVTGVNLDMRLRERKHIGRRVVKEKSKVCSMYKRYLDKENNGQFHNPTVTVLVLGYFTSSLLEIVKLEEQRS